jgi:hypothetical protein
MKHKYLRTDAFFKLTALQLTLAFLLVLMLPGIDAASSESAAGVEEQALSVDAAAELFRAYLHQPLQQGFWRLYSCPRPTRSGLC